MVEWRDIAANGDRSLAVEVDAAWKGVFNDMEELEDGTAFEMWESKVDVTASAFVVHAKLKKLFCNLVLRLASIPKICSVKGKSNDQVAKQTRLHKVDIGVMALWQCFLLVCSI